MNNAGDQANSPPDGAGDLFRVELTVIYDPAIPNQRPLADRDPDLTNSQPRGAEGAFDDYASRLKLVTVLWSTDSDTLAGVLDVRIAIRCVTDNTIAEEWSPRDGVRFSSNPRVPPGVGRYLRGSRVIVAALRAAQTRPGDRS